jgi:hypothetical protein
MKHRFRTSLVKIAIGVTVILMPVRSARAQEAEVVTTIAREIMEALGNETADFGGEAVAEQTAKRLLTEATEFAGSAGGQIAKTQVERILALGSEPLILDLKSISGKSLPLLVDASDDELPLLLATLARPGIEDGLESLGSTALQKAALAGETRLPGVGLKLVEHYGEEGAQLATTLNEDQANSVIAALRPNAINSLSAGERSQLLNALASRPDARVFNLEGLTGPLVVVASGIVVWHGIDVTLSPDEHVTELPDGTVVREKTSVGSRVTAAVPAAVHELSTPLKWTGISFAVGTSLVIGFIAWRWEKHVRS